MEAGGEMLASLLYFRRTFRCVQLLIAHSIEIIRARTCDAPRYASLDASYHEENVYAVARRFFGSELPLP